MPAMLDLRGWLASLAWRRRWLWSKGGGGGFGDCEKTEKKKGVEKWWWWRRKQEPPLGFKTVCEAFKSDTLYVKKR